MICQACGVEAPTKYVAFYQNIGLLILRLQDGVEGNLCKSCVHSHFWKYTAINFTLGWWGIIALIVNPFFIVNNTVRYVMVLGMDPVPPGAKPPQLTDELVERIAPQTEDLISRLNAGEPFETVVDDTARRVGGVTPGQIALYLHALAAAHEANQGQSAA